MKKTHKRCCSIRPGCATGKLLALSQVEEKKCNYETKLMINMKLHYLSSRR